MGKKSAIKVCGIQILDLIISPPVYLLTILTMGPVGLMKSNGKQKLLIIVFSNFFQLI